MAASAEYEARFQGLAGLVRMLMQQQESGRGARVRTGGQNQYVTGDETQDQSLDASQRYPLHRLEREPSLRSIAADHVEREKQRVQRTFHAGQIQSGTTRASRIDQAVEGAVRGTPASSDAGPTRVTLEAELKKLRMSPNSISDPVQKRIAEIKKLLAGMK